MCVCVYVYACMCVRVCACMCVCVYVCTCVRVYVCMIKRELASYQIDEDKQNSESNFTRAVPGHVLGDSWYC